MRLQMCAFIIILFSFSLAHAQEATPTPPVGSVEYYLELLKSEQKALIEPIYFQYILNEMSAEFAANFYYASIIYQQMDSDVKFFFRHDAMKIVSALRGIHQEARPEGQHDVIEDRYFSCAITYKLKANGTFQQHDDGRRIFDEAICVKQK